jgi:hypothetical protein
MEIMLMIIWISKKTEKYIKIFNIIQWYKKHDSIHKIILGISSYVRINWIIYPKFYKNFNSWFSFKYNIYFLFLFSI